MGIRDFGAFICLDIFNFSPSIGVIVSHILKEVIHKLESHADSNDTTSDGDRREGRDGVFVADSKDQLDGESRSTRESIDAKQVETQEIIVSTVIEQKQMQHDVDNIGVQSNQLESVNVPIRRRRQSLARSFAKSSNSDTAAYAAESLNCRDGGYLRSASLPPMSRSALYQSEVASKQSGDSGRNSLSAFLSFKKKQASLTAALAAFDGASPDLQSCMSSVTMTQDKEGDGGKSVDSCPNVPYQSSALLTSTSPADHRFDQIHPVGTVDLDEILSEQRQSPEPFQSSAPLPQCCSPSPQQGLIVPALGSSDFTISLLHRLRMLSEYTLCTPAAAVASCDTPTTTLVKHFRSTPEKPNASFLSPQTDAHFITDLKPDKSTDSETSLETLSVDEDELQVDKDCEVKVVCTRDEDPGATCTDTDIGVEVANGRNGVIDVGVEFDVHKETIDQLNAIHDALLKSKRHCQADPPPERASTPRTDILNQHGWIEHHRFARHRQSSSENPQIAVLPLNHMSRALVVNGGVGRVSGLHHGLVKSGSAKDLTELRALTDELSELRNWKVLATKTLDAAREELKAMEGLRAARAAALDESTKLRLELDELRNKSSSLTAMLNDNAHAQGLVAPEKVPNMKCGITLASSTTVHEQNEAEKEESSVEMVLESNAEILESELDVKAGPTFAALNEGSMFAELQERLRINEVKQKESILKYESMLLAKDEVISLLTSEHEQITQRTSKLESALVACKQAAEAVANELCETKVQHATVEIRLEVEQKARINGNEKLEAATRDVCTLQKKLTRSESEIREMKDRLSRCQLENEDLVTRISTLQDQLQQAQDGKYQLGETLKKAEESIASKHQEVSFLAACVTWLQDQLQETEESFRRKLMDERGPRLGETHRLKAQLFAKEKELSHLKNNLNASIAKARKIQDELDVMNLMAQPKAAEIANLREMNEDNVKTMNEIKSECGKMQAIIIDKESEISFLQGICSEQKQAIEGLKREIADCIDDKRSFEQKLLVMTEERNSTQADARSKSAIISDLEAANNRMLQDINKLSSLSSQKTAKQQTTIGSEIYEQRIKGLERELGRQQAKYQSATAALKGMEVALLVRFRLFALALLTDFSSLPHMKHRLTSLPL